MLVNEAWRGKGRFVIARTIPYSLLNKFISKLCSHAAQRNVRCSACCNVWRLSETTHPLLQLHLSHVSGGPASVAQEPLPSSSNTYSSSLHRAFGHHNLFSCFSPIRVSDHPFLRKAFLPFTIRQIPNYVSLEVVASSYLLLLFYIYLATVWWTPSPPWDC